MLPVPLTRFVGREAELTRATALLADARLLTLTGPGGAGKTRLALRLASVVAEDFPDGTWFVDFSPLSDGQFVWDRVALTLGVKEPGSGRTLAEAVGRRLAASQAMVVLDNCEHLAGSAAEVAASLLTAAPAVKVVATSREPLAVDGEVTWAVPPLSEPDAVELFSDRARQVRPDFTLRDSDADAVLSICRRVDGLPLAIELAAARTRALDPARIAIGLKDRLAFLPSGPRTAPQRQLTLAASFDWSHDLLSGPEQALLRQLSVFTGGFDVDAALAVCPSASMELLAALTDRSMIVVERRDELSEPRYRMLETVREFAAEHLDEAQEVDLIRTRHRDHYLALAEMAAPRLEGPQQRRWMDRLRVEQDNLRAALSLSRDRGELESLARMMGALFPFWGMQGQFIELRMWLESVEGRGDELSPRLRAGLRIAQCTVAFMYTRSFGEVPALATEALALSRECGDQRLEVYALCCLGVMAGMLGGAGAMRPYLNQALDITRSIGYVAGAVMALMFFTVLRWFRSEPEQSRRLAAEAMAMAKSGGDSHQFVWATYVAGMTAVLQGRLDEADQLLQAAVAEGRRESDTVAMSAPLGLALVRMFRGEFAAARAAVTESLAAAERSDAEGGSLMLIDPSAKLTLGWMDLVSGGNVAEAKGMIEPLVDGARALGVPFVTALPLLLLVEAQMALGALEDCAAGLEEATELARAGELPWVLGRVSLARAKLRVREGNLQEAETLAHEALGLAREAGDQLGLVDALELLAQLAAAQDSNVEAVRLWAAAESVRTKLGYARFPIDKPAHEAAAAKAKQSLGGAEFANACAEGAKLTAEEAIAYAARGRGERKRPSTGWASLTPSELEVARLVGQHLSNPEIASKLFVSRATVKTHLVHIFAKLGFDSRSELAAEAVKRRS